MADRINGIFNEAIALNPKIADHLRRDLPRMRVAASLVRLRNALGFTQRAIAELMRTPQSNVARLERASGNLQTTEALVAYAKACGLTVGLVFIRPERETFQVVEATAIGGDNADQFMRSFVAVESKYISSDDRSAEEAEAEEQPAGEGATLYR